MLEPQIESRPAIYRVFILSLAAPFPGDIGHHNSNISGDTDHPRQDEGGSYRHRLGLGHSFLSKIHTASYCTISTVETRKP